MCMLNMKKHLMKKIIINHLGGFSFQKLLQKNNIPHNASFAGIYSFEESNKYPKLFTSMLGSIQNKGLIMCHPGFATLDQTDPIAKVRYDEYCYLSSDQYFKDLKSYDIILSRFSEIPSCEAS